jgi:hypothetical protein
MAALMKMYTMEETPVWNDAISLVNSCKMEEALKILEECGDKALISYDVFYSSMMPCTSTNPLEATESLEDAKLLGEKRKNRDPIEGNYSKKAKA